MATITLSENENQQHIEITVDDIIQPQLNESPSTGYKWQITEINTNELQIISEDFQLNPDAGIEVEEKNL